MRVEGALDVARPSNQRPEVEAATGGRRTRPSAAPHRPLEHRILLTATLCLLAGGAVMVYSASSARDLLGAGGDGSAFLLRYVGYGALGLLAMHVLTRVRLEAVRKATPVLLVVAFGLVALTLIPGIGVEVNGGRRWLGPGPLQFQPSELMKLALILYTVRMLAADPGRVRSLRELASPLLLVAGAACALVAVQPDLGTALVIAFSLTTLLVVAGLPLRTLGILAAGVGVCVLLFALVEPYRRARLTAFVNPWADAGGAGFQSVQGQIALGSGGLFGVGLGQSVQKVFYLPEAHTDFILAVVGEELGVTGILGLLSLYGMLAYAGLRTAKTARGSYAKLLAAGLTAVILCQATLNVFTVLGLAPLTGVPLPFISYGSSNLLVLLAAMGLLLNVAAGGAAPASRPCRARSRWGLAGS
ncbi:MAG: putative lipid II flippase FtsW, partial [Solirubrobacteraceae bacterium]